MTLDAAMGLLYALAVIAIAGVVSGIAIMVKRAIWG